MRNFKFYLFYLLTMLLISSCSVDGEKKSSTSSSEEEIFVLESKTSLGDGIFLPQGTEWYYVDKEHSAVEFKLPKGYSFLVQNSESGKYSLSQNPEGGYSCSCSGENSCKTFYNKDVGYGCLQSTCTGSCTGTPTTNNNEIIEGVLIEKYANLQGTKSKFEKAYLSPNGKSGFFQVASIQNEIARNMKMAFESSGQPDFSLIDLGDFDKHKLVLADVQLYGFHFGIPLPDDGSLDQSFSNISYTKNPEAPTQCSCDTEGQTGCELQKDCFLGQCAYHCDGCSTCTMS
ncbi:hypothetical protein [Gramella sp. AN32]|uniref:Lipoprotein n=1 Tax=Christiangramia antarctica TaxID=2058158 RepID=A0ABW5X8J1_9FLAO|nr:hypothetical protein [Gramella sp. AN32]MCM4154418.1 hypothetical protein [Gramella sp. AN32]